VSCWSISQKRDLQEWCACVVGEDVQADLLTTTAQPSGAMTTADTCLSAHVPKLKKSNSVLHAHTHTHNFRFVALCLSLSLSGCYGLLIRSHYSHTNSKLASCSFLLKQSPCCPSLSCSRNTNNVARILKGQPRDLAATPDIAVLLLEVFDFLLLILNVNTITQHKLNRAKGE